MIIKCLSRKSGTRQILNYLFKHKEKLVHDQSKPLIIRKNVRSRTLDKWVKEFKANEAMRIHQRKNSVEVYHTVLSFSAKDKEHINERMLRDIAKQYMKERGEKNLYIGTAHFDRDHVHLHIVMSGTKYMTGLANRQSMAEFQKLKLSMDAFQKRKYPALINSLPRHGRCQDKKTNRGTPKERSLYGRASQKESLLKALDMAYTRSKSMDGFLDKLRKMGHEPYTRGGRVTGVKFEGDRKFRFSTLGYDRDKIAKMEADAEKDKQELDELSEIRDNAGGRDRDTESQGRTMKDEDEDKDSADQDESYDDCDMK
jgi:hypothetical protein